MKQLNVSFMEWFNIPDFLLNFQNWLQNPQKVIQKMIFVCNMDWRKQIELHSVRVADNKNHWVHFIIKECMYVHVCIYLLLKKISCFLLGKSMHDYPSLQWIINFHDKRVTNFGSSLSSKLNVKYCLAKFFNLK